VIPTARDAIAVETPESLAERMERILDRYASGGFHGKRWSAPP